MIRIYLAIAALVLCPSSSFAQQEALASGLAGLVWQGSSGTAVGTCTGFTCAAPISVTAVAGESIVLSISAGVLDAPYALLVSTQAGPCQTFPGVAGFLTLGPQILVGATGLTSEPNSVGFCGFVMDQHMFTVPNGIPPGTHLVIQAVAWQLSIINGAPQAAIVDAIDVTFS